RYLKSIGCSYMEFIPVVERCGGNGLAQPQGKHIAMTPWSVDSLQYGRFLNAVSDIWIREDIGDIGIQL
ncbi:anaerobic sulfatase maturase, partial [Salmonella enterica]